MASMSKEEYLKRYLSEDTSKPKKKKKKIKAVRQSNLRIIDDDVDLKTMHTAGVNEEENDDDEAPTVAEVVDERPEHVQRLEAYRKDQRWKVLSNEKKDQDIAKQDYGVISTGITSKLHPQRHHLSDSDASPPRKRRHDSDSDCSPPRRKHNVGKSPSKKQRHDSDSDQSPRRKQRHDSDSDQSPRRRLRHDSDSDQSPARRLDKGKDAKQLPLNREKGVDTKLEQVDSKKRHDGVSDSDELPQRKKRHDSDSDQSLPRKKRHDSNSDQSPPRRKNKDSDQSPPRKKRHNSDSDQSPPRRKNKNSDQSPPRKKHDNDSDQSPPRRKNKESDYSSQLKRKSGNTSDQSPRRKKGLDHSSSIKERRGGDLSSSQQKTGREESGAKPNKTLGGAKAGLSSAAEMKQEAEKLRKKEDEMFAKIDHKALGRDSTTVFRDKSGKRRNLAAEQKEEEEDERRKAEEDKKYQEWGQGLKQKELREQAVEDYVYEASKPLARHKDDQDLDRMMRELDREGDPMARFLKKKPKKEDTTPRYRGPPPPPNRFGILPGYRWDGVNRSNGFEKQLFTKMSEKKAVSEHAYKWSIEDM